MAYNLQNKLNVGTGETCSSAKLGSQTEAVKRRGRGEDVGNAPAV